MSRPQVSDLSEVLYAAMGFWGEEDEANDWTLLLIVASLVEALLDSVYEIAREGEDGEAGWSIALDPVNAPLARLPYLAQFVGAVLTPNMDEAQRRAEIKEPTTWRRGQPASIELIAKRELTGTKWVRIRPRSPEVGHTYIRTLLSETPNPAHVERELLERGVPAWELLDYEAIEGVTVADVANGWKTVEELAAAFSTVAEVTHLLPDQLPE